MTVYTYSTDTGEVVLSVDNDDVATLTPDEAEALGNDLIENARDARLLVREASQVVLTDEPGRITKLTGPRSVSSPGPAARTCGSCGANAVVTHDRNGSPYTFCNHCGAEPEEGK